MNIRSIFILLFLTELLLTFQVSSASEKSPAVQPGIAELVGSNMLPGDVENKIKAEYKNGKNFYKAPADFKSKISDKKLVKVSEQGETYFLLVFPELVHLTEGFGENGIDAQSSCDVIQFRQKDGKISVLPKEDIEGECITYFLSKPMVMDLNQDGNADIVFIGNFKQPQVGGEVTSPKVFLFNKNTQSFCYSSKASEYIDADLKKPEDIFNNARKVALKDSKKLECDEIK